MNIQQIFATDALAASAVTPAMTELVERVRPSVVQVQSGGRGNGTGIIWGAGGQILTNDHVVAHASGAIQVALTDGRTFAATLKRRSPELDLALLTIDAADLPAAQQGDSSALRVGELVFAVGHPWGQPWVVTAGIVSAHGELPARGGRAASYIRSDVRLAPGNSGGPLLSASGALIGINAMIFGGDLAVAIPVHVAQRWLVEPEGDGQRGTLGVSVQQVELPASALIGAWAGRAAGLLVVAIAPGSAADRAGLLIGDVLLDVSGAAVESAAALRDALSGTQRAQLYLLRGGAALAVDVALIS